MSNAAELPLTARARVALAIARGIAAGRGDDDLTPAHVALGVLREGENPAVALLELVGVDLTDLHQSVERELGSPGLPRPGEVVVPLTPGENRIVDQAGRESQLRGDDHIGPHHLLLALLRDAESSIAQLFTRVGIGYKTAASELEIVFGPTPEPPSSGGSGA